MLGLGAIKGAAGGGPMRLPFGFRGEHPDGENDPAGILAEPGTDATGSTGEDLPAATPAAASAAEG